MDKKQECLEKGYISVRAIIEMLGKPKKHVASTFEKVISKLEEEEDIIILKEQRSDIKEQDKMFSVFTELEFMAKDTSAITAFCFNYMPSSVEIEEPVEKTMTNVEFTKFYSDLQAKLHSIDRIIKESNSENMFLKKNFQTMLRNMLSILLNIRPSTLNELKGMTGIKEEELKPYLEKLVEDNVLKKEGDVYSHKGAE